MTGRLQVGSHTYKHRPRSRNRRHALARVLLVLALVTIPWRVALAQGAAGITILAFGDSLTAGLGVETEQSFPARLERALRGAGVDARVINAGVSGDTTSGGLARLDWTLAESPALVILELGANDALRGIPPAVTEANLDRMLAQLGAKRIPVLLAGMLAPPNLGAEYGAAFNAIYPRLAQKHGVPLYPFFLEGLAAQPALLQNDGMHPNARGVEVIVAGILPHVRAALGGASPR
ncbi:MAG: arylesterase [Alphaproteobacteria bacterium]|nr:arylesterase [Alphaproteobacteria bacterium]